MANPAVSALALTMLLAGAGEQSLAPAPIRREATASQAQPTPPAADPRFDLEADDARRLAQRVHAGRDVTPGTWPEGRRVAVALTFDLDAELVWLEAPEASSPGELSRGGYGPRAGLRRILALLDRRELPATFFLPALILDLHPEAVAAIRERRRHELGLHGWGHENVGSLTPAQERAALERALARFRAAGLEPSAYRSPAWDFSPATVGLLAELGLGLDSSLMGDDRPYELLSAGRPTGLIELPVTWLLDDWPYFELEWDVPLAGLRDPQEVLAIWKAEFDAIRDEGGLFMLTLHPQVIGRATRIRMLEQLLDHIDAAGDAWYATVSQIGAACLRPSRASSRPE